MARQGAPTIVFLSGVDAGAGVLQCNFTLKNTGKAVETDPAMHRMNANAWLTSDIYRLSVSVESKGWSARPLCGLRLATPLELSRTNLPSKSWDTSSTMSTR